MAVKICAGSDCIQCDRYASSAEAVTEEIAQAEKAGKKFYCCGSKCINISKITTVVGTSLPGDDDDEDPDRPDEPGKPGNPGSGGIVLPVEVLDNLPLRIRIDND